MGPLGFAIGGTDECVRPYMSGPLQWLRERWTSGNYGVCAA
jgi:hypothetical protein